MDATDFESFFPERVISSLTSEQLKEARSIHEEYFINSPIPDITLYRQLGNRNPGVQYLLLATSLKYSLLRVPHLDEPELLEMLEFDFQRLDLPHESLYGYLGEAKALDEQRLNNVECALGNPNLTHASALKLLRQLLASPVEDSNLVELINTIAYSLLDKWGPQSFSSGALLALVQLMEEYGAVEFLPKFKKLQRKAQAQEQTN